MTINKENQLAKQPTILFSVFYAIGAIAASLCYIIIRDFTQIEFVSLMFALASLVPFILFLIFRRRWLPFVASLPWLIYFVYYGCIMLMMNQGIKALLDPFSLFLLYFLGLEIYAVILWVKRK